MKKSASANVNVHYSNALEDDSFSPMNISHNHKEENQCLTSACPPAVLNATKRKKIQKGEPRSGHFCHINRLVYSYNNKTHFQPNQSKRFFSIENNNTQPTQPIVVEFTRLEWLSSFS